MGGVEPKRIRLLKRQAFWMRCMAYGLFYDALRLLGRPVAEGGMSVRWALGKFMTYHELEQ